LSTKNPDFSSFQQIKIFSFPNPAGIFTSKKINRLRIPNSFLGKKSKKDLKTVAIFSAKSLLKKLKLILPAIFALQISSLPSQEVSLEKNIRIALWASTEAFPGIDDFQKKDDLNSLPISKIRQTAPFILSGMIYGWNFDYTPYDKKRNVQEYFDFSPVQELSPQEISRIKYASPWIKEQRLNVWVEYERTPAQIMLYNSWKSVNFRNIRGVGYAPLSEGFEGIQKACGEALKQAVRAFERNHVKTKPKEIAGKALLSKPPVIGIDAGRYMVALDFFMESDRIVEYKTF